MRFLLLTSLYFESFDVYMTVEWGSLLGNSCYLITEIDPLLRERSCTLLSCAYEIVTSINPSVSKYLSLKLSYA